MRKLSHRVDCCKLELFGILKLGGIYKRSRFSETQIVGILKEADVGLKVMEICRKYGISDATYYNWKSKYGGLQVSEVRRL